MGPKLKLDLGVVAHDVHEAPLAVQDARGGVGGVALGGDPLVPVVVGVSGILDFHRFQPGILPRWLVEMTVDTDVTRRCLFHRCLPGVAA